MKWLVVSLQKILNKVWIHFMTPCHHPSHTSLSTSKNNLKFSIRNLFNNSHLNRGGDNCAILDFSQRHLTGHSWTYLRDFQKRRIFFFEKLPPCTAKTVFENPKGGAFGSEKTVFAVQGGNFSKKKILRFWKSLKYV